MAELLYAAVALALDGDPLIDEMAVAKDLALLGLPPEASAAGFAVVEHKLAISRAAVGQLWAAGLQELRELRRGCVDASTPEGRRRVHHATRAILLANTDHYTAWNARKRHLLAPGWLAPEDELRLVDLLLAKHPKSGEAWSHRRWVLARPALGSNPGGVAAAVTHELAVCASAARAYPKNYFAWTHRYWALSRLAPPELAAVECDTMRQWAAINTSDHAGLHYRGSAVLLAAARAVQRELLLPDPSDSAGPAACWSSDSDSDSAGEAIWQQAWEQGNELQGRYPGHESMWRHRRLLAWMAHALGSAAVSLQGELEYGAARQQLAKGNAVDDSIAEREQRQWSSEELCATQYLRWAQMALKPP